MVLVESFLLVAGNCLEQCPCAVQCNGRVQIFETKKVQRSLDIICQSFWFLVLQMTCLTQFPTASMIILRHLLQQATSSSSSSFKSNSTKECQGVKPIADSSGTLASKKSLSTMCNVWYQPKWCVHYYKLQSVWSCSLCPTDWKSMFCIGSGFKLGNLTFVLSASSREMMFKSSGGVHGWWFCKFVTRFGIMGLEAV